MGHIMYLVLEHSSFLRQCATQARRRRGWRGDCDTLFGGGCGLSGAIVASQTPEGEAGELMSTRVLRALVQYARNKTLLKAVPVLSRRFN